MLGFNTPLRIEIEEIVLIDKPHKQRTRAAVRWWKLGFNTPLSIEIEEIVFTDKLQKQRTRTAATGGSSFRLNTDGLVQINFNNFRQHSQLSWCNDTSKILCIVCWNLLLF